MHGVASSVLQAYIGLQHRLANGAFTLFSELLRDDCDYKKLEIRVCTLSADTAVLACMDLGTISQWRVHGEEKGAVTRAHSRRWGSKQPRQNSL